MSSRDVGGINAVPRSERASGITEDGFDGRTDFSALNLRDRVVIMLLFDQIVCEEQVANVWPLWKQQSTSETELPIWRMLTLVPEINRELIFAEAARVYGIEEVHIERRGALPIIERVYHHCPRPLWDQLVRLRTVPVAAGTQQHSQRSRLIFATHDPMNPDLQELLPQLGMGGYEVRYAPEEDVVNLLADAFPWKYKALREAFETEREMFAQVAEEAPVEAEEVEATAPEPEPAAEKKAASEFDTSSITSFFEDVLVEAVRRESESVCITPNGNGQTELFFQQGADLTEGVVVEGMVPTIMMDTIKHTIIKDQRDHPGEPPTQVIKRWIEGQPRQFRVSALPPSETINLESIVVRVLN
ncbi:MAG TPA: hypothetical protein VKP65_02065 [Rhodothermales bacterium]|nr:hypothetical protein [Rhodothermales bacterium]